MEEAILLGSFPTYGANGTRSFVLSGAMPDGYELRELQVVFELTVIRDVGAAFAIAAADHNTIAAAFVARIRGSFFGQNDTYNATPPESRTIAYYANGRDPFQSDPNFRVAQNIPAAGGATQRVNLTFSIPFCHRGLDTEEMFAPSTDQFNLASPASKIDIETGASASGATLVLTNGSSVTTISDIKVYGICTRAPLGLVHAGPMHIVRPRSVTQIQDSDDSPALDLLVADERAYATVAGQVSQFTVYRDDVAAPRNIDPRSLAQQFGQQQPPADGIANMSLDLTSNAIGGTGAVITPLVWLSGRSKVTEFQWPVHYKRRTVYQTLAAGGSPAATYLTWQIKPITEPGTQDQLRALVKKYQTPVASLDDLPVRGYGEPGALVHRLFKGRFVNRSAKRQ